MRIQKTVNHIYFGERSYKMRAFDKRRNSISTQHLPNMIFADFCYGHTGHTDTAPASFPDWCLSSKAQSAWQVALQLAAGEPEQNTAVGPKIGFLTSKIGATNPNPHQPSVSSYFTSAISIQCVPSILRALPHDILPVVDSQGTSKRHTMRFRAVISAWVRPPNHDGTYPVTVCCGKMDKNGPSNVMIDLLEIAVFHSYVKNYKRVNHDVTSRKDGFTSLTSQNGT